MWSFSRRRGKGERAAVEERGAAARRATTHERRACVACGIGSLVDRPVGQSVSRGVLCLLWGWGWVVGHTRTIKRRGPIIRPLLLGFPRRLQHRPAAAGAVLSLALWAAHSFMHPSIHPSTKPLRLIPTIPIPLPHRRHRPTKKGRRPITGHHTPSSTHHYVGVGYRST